MLEHVHRPTLLRPTLFSGSCGMVLDCFAEVQGFTPCLIRADWQTVLPCNSATINISWVEDLEIKASSLALWQIA